MEVTLAQQAAKIDLSVKQRLIVERLARSRTEPGQVEKRELEYERHGTP